MKVGRIAAASFVLMLAAAIAAFAEEVGAPTKPQPIRVDGAQLQRSAGADNVTFTVTIVEPGDYVVIVELGVRTTTIIVLNLELDPESGNGLRQTKLSGGGERCG